MVVIGGPREWSRRGFARVLAGATVFLAVRLLRLLLLLLLLLGEKQRRPGC